MRCVKGRPGGTGGQAEDGPILKTIWKGQCRFLLTDAQEA